MKNNLPDYKKLFREKLLPFFEMLSSKHFELSHLDWIQFIEKTHLSVLSNPEQYLGKELPSQDFMKQIIAELFDEFVHEGIAILN